MSLVADVDGGEAGSEAAVLFTDRACAVGTAFRWHCLKRDGEVA